MAISRSRGIARHTVGGSPYDRRDLSWLWERAVKGQARSGWKAGGKPPKSDGAMGYIPVDAVQRRIAARHCKNDMEGHAMKIRFLALLLGLAAGPALARRSRSSRPCR